jgi:hypothetical protein
MLGSSPVAAYLAASREGLGSMSEWVSEWVSAWLPLLLYERDLNYIKFVASLLVLSILKFLMIRFAKLQSNTNGNTHTVRSVLSIIMSLLMLIVIEMLTAVRFATQRENHS